VASVRAALRRYLTRSEVIGRNLMSRRSPVRERAGKCAGWFKPSR
jgi:hypothetical protein